MTHRNRVAVCLLALALTAPVLPQSSLPPQMPGIPDASESGRRRGTTADRTFEDLMKENEKKINKQRQADLKRDTDKLLNLATELKAYVDKSNENVLSLEVLKKCEEIEKLAKSVQNKMKGPQ